MKPRAVFHYGKPSFFMSPAAILCTNAGGFPQEPPCRGISRLTSSSLQDIPQFLLVSGAMAAERILSITYQKKQKRRSRRPSLLFSIFLLTALSFPLRRTLPPGSVPCSRSRRTRGAVRHISLHTPRFLPRNSPSVLPRFP